MHRNCKTFCSRSGDGLAQTSWRLRLRPALRLSPYTKPVLAAMVTRRVQGRRCRHRDARHYAELSHALPRHRITTCVFRPVYMRRKYRNLNEPKYVYLVGSWRAQNWIFAMENIVDPRVQFCIAIIYIRPVTVPSMGVGSSLPHPFEDDW